MADPSILATYNPRNELLRIGGKFLDMTHEEFLEFAKITPKQFQELMAPFCKENGHFLTRRNTGRWKCGVCTKIRRARVKKSKLQGLKPLIVIVDEWKGIDEGPVSRGCDSERHRAREVG